MMNAYHIYVVGENPPREFELITQIYSCLNHRISNPELPLYLVTDLKSKDFFESYNITKLYDAVITDIFDDYPYEQISHRYWASPKIWAMSKLQTPFVVYDTDLVLNKNIQPYTNLDLLYLHRETTSTYPNIFDVHHNENFEWDVDFAKSLKDTLPMNCAVVGMFNEEFKKEYTDFYFNFVLNSTGEISYATEKSHFMYDGNGAQIMMEQWLLAGLAHDWQKRRNIDFKTKSFCNIIHTSETLRLIDMDSHPDEAITEISSTMYHLWGAKEYQDKVEHEVYKRAQSQLIGAEWLVLQSPYYDVIKDSYYSLIEKIK